MRKVFTLLTMCMLASMAWAGVITFDPAVDKGTSGEQASAYDVPKENVNIHVSNGLVAADKGVWAYRVYKGQTMTFTCEDASILKIEVECAANGVEKYGPGCFTVDLPSYTYEESGPNGTWVGSSNSVVFTASSNQVRATKIVVTTGEAGLVAPVISPAGGKFYLPINVSITCPTPNAQIYYTTNGSTPTTGSTRYTAPFSVSTNTTVKAISVLDSDVSDVVSAEFTYGGDATRVANIAAYKAVPDETLVVFTNPVTVLAQSGSRMFVQDDTGNALFFGNAGQNYKNGDVIPAGFAGVKTTWDGEAELKDLECFMAPTSNSPVAPLEITCNQVSGNLFGKYVLLKNVTFDVSAKKVQDESGEAPYYCNMNISNDDILAGHTYNLWAIVGSYGKQNTTYQLLPIKLEDLGGEEPPIEGVACIEELYALNQGTVGHFTTPLTAVYQNGPRLYVRDYDDHFTLVYGSLTATFENGDYINGAEASWTLYQNNKQLSPVAETFVVAGHSTPVEPEYMSIEEVSADMIHRFLAFEVVTIECVEENGRKNYTMYDETGSMILYDQFHELEKIQNFDTDFYVEGFLTVYNGTLELYPTKVQPLNDCGLKGDVNGDDEINIADVNALIDIILSGKTPDDCTMWRADVAADNELGIADVNALIDMILKM